MTIAHLPSPVGDLELEERDGALVRLSWASGDAAPSTPLLQEAARQIAAYFAGELTAFDLPLAPAGNAFRQDVYRAMLAIPRGETATYGEIAKALGPIARAFRTKILPVSFGFPFGLSVVLPVNVPLPTKITMQTLPPIDVAAEFGEDPDIDDETQWRGKERWRDTKQ